MYGIRCYVCHFPEYCNYDCNFWPRNHFYSDADERYDKMSKGHLCLHVKAVHVVLMCFHLFVPP